MLTGGNTWGELLLCLVNILIGWLTRHYLPPTPPTPPTPLPPALPATLPVVNPAPAVPIK